MIHDAKPHEIVVAEVRNDPSVRRVQDRDELHLVTTMTVVGFVAGIEKDYLVIGQVEEAGQYTNLVAVRRDQIMVLARLRRYGANQMRQTEPVPLSDYVVQDDGEVTEAS